MSTYIGAVDSGTTSSRFLIFDEHGNLITYHQVQHTMLYPEPGWVEMEPEAILAAVVECIDKAIKRFEMMGRLVSDIKAIGITNQRETALVWDRKHGKSLHSAIVWSDTRTHEIVKNINSNKDKAVLVRDLSGLPVTTYFSAVKYKWLLENCSAVQTAVESGDAMFGTIDSWLMYHLTGGALQGGVHVTDVTNASRTLLMNLKSLEWDPALLNIFNVPESVLPKIVSSAEVYGHVKSGPLEGIPVAGCLGDQQAALVGQKCFQKGDAKNTFGTGAFMLFNTGDEPLVSQNGMVTTVGFQFGKNKPAYALEGSIASAGSAIKWTRDNLGLISSSEEIGPLAASVEDSGGVYFVTAFSGLFAPYWRDDARACIVGITHFTTRNHIARATLESMCYQTRAILDCMKQDADAPLRSLKVDGGVSNSDEAMQILSDVLGIDVTRPKMRETTALGAAIAAGYAIGRWTEYSDLDNVNVEGVTSFQPKIDTQKRDNKYKDWAKAIERSYGWAQVSQVNETIAPNAPVSETTVPAA
ncbi:Glycerol kinase [Umbelopsis sp. WA50703]